MSAIIYLLQVSACLTIFYGFYYLLLNRLTFFTINRYYLLAALVLSFIIPLLTIPVHHEYTAAPVMQQVIQMRSIPTIPNYTFTPITTPIQTTSPITWMQLLNWGYLAAVTGLSIHLIITLFNFFTKLKHRKLSSLGNIHILRGDKKLPNGSFLNYIFLNDDALSAKEMEQIVAHEMLHVKLFHSADRILMKLVQIILWFNPFVYLYARSMEENHEFEVDREVARSTDKTQYADLLLHLSVANQGMLYHGFSKVPLKKRIIMLFNQPSAKVKKAVYILILPVIAISCLAFAKIKKDDIKIDLIQSGKQLLTAIKTGQNNIIDQLNQPVQLPAIMENAANINAVMLNTRSIKNISINTASQFGTISTLHDTTRYSAFGNVSNNIKVTINGKEYPSDILYEISNSNLSGISVSINRSGQNGLINTIDIKTANGQIIYMTAHEKDNLRKEKTTPISQFYTRLQLTKENGERYDYIVIRLYNAVGRDAQNQLSNVPGLQHRDLRIGPNDKVGFMINGKFYSEDEIKSIPPGTIASLNRFGSATYGGDMLYQNKYKFVFTINSPEYAELYNNTINGGGSMYGGGGRIYTYDFTNQGYMTLPFVLNNGFIGGPSDFKGFSDTTEYSTSPYKVRANGPLIDLINNIPTVAVNDKGVFSMDKKITTLLIDGQPYNGDILQGLKSLPADIFGSFRLSKSAGTLNVITKPK